MEKIYSYLWHQNKPEIEDSKIVRLRMVPSPSSHLIYGDLGKKESIGKSRGRGRDMRGQIMVQNWDDD